MWSGPPGDSTLKYRADLGGPRDRFALEPAAGCQRIGRRQRAHVLRIGLAQEDVGELVIEHRALTAFDRIPHAVQRHGADAPRRGVVVAVGVPADRAVGVRNELAARSRARVIDEMPVVVRQVVAVQMLEAELQASRRGMSLSSCVAGER